MKLIKGRIGLHERYKTLEVTWYVKNLEQTSKIETGDVPVD